jgi:large subunit ribosomal protein L4
MCLSDKAQNQAFWVVDNFNFTESKTKLFASLLKSLGAKQKSFLVLADNGDKKLVKIARNIPKLTIEPARNVNVMDLVNKQAVIVTKNGVAEIEKILTTVKE